MSDGQSTSVGEAVAADAWRILEGNPRAVLVDVRTAAEWTYVGVPDLAALGRRPLLLEWQRFPSGEVNGNFAAELAARLTAAGVGTGDTLLFVCRSGARSRAAAEAMAAAGYDACINVTDGFEGPRDAAGHRGTQAGWKAAGLPWMQS